MLHLSEDDVRALLPMPVAVDLLAAAFARWGAGQAQNQPRRRLVLPTGAVLHQMAAADGAYFGTKIYSTHRTGAHFHCLLYAAEDGRPLALLEANELGRIRTGAASGYATRLLAQPEACAAAVIGTGFQARTQLEALAAVLPLRRVRVWGRDPERRRRFAEECSAAFGIGVEPAESAEAAVRDAAVVTTVTSSREPVIEDAWIGPGVHVNAAGSNQARRRELPPELVRRAALIAVDSIEQARIESGDLLGVWIDDDWAGPPIVELKDCPGRHGLPGDAVTIFNSLGVAVEDVAVAAYVYEQALAQGIGRPL
ncbi:MAG: ornithine cyclodeaminase family protein [Bryobacterales bacterium]|nr:ornithine cyclodeaminase family protein [Bryobacterales bacterium]